MRRLPLLVLSLLALLAVAACSSGGAPGWTYAPAPSTTPAASGDASGAPSAGASAAPSAAASAAPSQGASAAPSGGAGLTITAAVGATTGGFDPETAETAADTPFTLTFDNQDDQAPHNLVLQNPDGSAVAVQGDTAFFTGPGQRVYQVPALASGEYKYVCQVHLSTMVGTLTAK